MLSKKQKEHWENYLQLEKDKSTKNEILLSLNKFIDSINNLDKIKKWVFDLSKKIIDDDEKIPLRFPLFEKIIYPVLRNELNKKNGSAARLLAGFNQLVYQLKDYKTGLFDENEHSLLTKAIKYNSADIQARERLVKSICHSLDNSLHELPTGVLFGHDGATAKECDLLLKELENLKVHLEKLNKFDNYEKYYEFCKTHYQAYKDYLLNQKKYSSYKEYMKKNHIPAE